MQEYRRIQKILKAVKALRQLQEMLKNLRDAAKQRELLREFRNENEGFLKELSPEELEEVREKADFDPAAWEKILHELFDS